MALIINNHPITFKLNVAHCLSETTLKILIKIFYFLNLGLTNYWISIGITETCRGRSCSNPSKIVYFSAWKWTFNTIEREEKGDVQKEPCCLQSQDKIF
jgi:hypothetical protein